MILHTRALLRSLAVLSVAVSAPAFAQAEVAGPERPFSGRVSLEARLPERSDPAGSLAPSLDLRVRQSLSESVWASGALELHVAPSFDVPYADLTVGTRLGNDPTRSLAVTLMPVTGTRERLGFDPLLGFGGNLYLLSRSFASRAQLDLQRWHVWAAAQTTAVANPFRGEEERLFAPSAGLGYQTSFGLRVDAEGAFYALGLAGGLGSQGIRLPLDANRARVLDDASGTSTLVADKPWVFGGDVVLQLVL